jgi:predicted N-acyltransferase
MHYLADPRLSRAVAEYLTRERRAVAHYVTEMNGQSALRR